ncbi:MAG: tyrosine-type recombinase/integrase [Terriglobales bacterium]
MARRAKGEGSLLLLKGCSVYYAQYYEDGRQVRVSTGERVKQKALTELRRLMGKSENGQSTVGLKKIRYGELRAALIANYTEKGNRSLEQRADGTETIVGLKQLDEFFGFKPAKPAVDGESADPGNPGVPVTALTTDAARKFAKKREKEGAGPAMINRSLACLRRMLHLAYEERKIPAVPKIRLYKEPPARKGFLELQKFEELVKQLPTHLRPLILFLYWCGVRLGEALQIEWEQVDLQNRVIRLEEEQTKNAEPRIVPLPAVLVNFLTEVEPKVGCVFDGTNLRTEWARACAAVGLGTIKKVKSESGHTWHQYDGLIVHDLRRSAVRNLRRAGVPENVAMKISGHKTRAVFDRYNIVSTDDIAEAMRRVEISAVANSAGDTITAGQQQAALPAPAPASESEKKKVCRVPRVSVKLVKIGQEANRPDSVKARHSNKMGA